MGIHDGHRDRVRLKMQSKQGLDSFAEHEVLEWMLYHAIPRGDTNPVAHALMERFGDLAGVLDADYDQLCKVKGVGPAAALFLCNYLDVYKRYRLSKYNRKRIRFFSLEEMADYLRVHYLKNKDERLFALFLTGSLELLKCEQISEGSVSSVHVDMRRLTELCLQTKSQIVVLSHNHPSNILYASTSDVQTTTDIADLLKPLGVLLLDHIIVGDDSFESMAKSKEYNYIFASTKNTK